MKTSAVCLLGAVILAGCERVKEAPVAPPAPLPVVHQAPVETHPFEDGYNAGYALGESKAKPGAMLPTEAEIETLARTQMGSATGRTEHWLSGFVEGYLDGFRKVVTGQK